MTNQERIDVSKHPLYKVAVAMVPQYHTAEKADQGEAAMAIWIHVGNITAAVATDLNLYAYDVCKMAFASA